ncbi:hypothetical protein ACGFLS_10010 [Streptomyces abikoensis]|uniref:hypothetical protein n=1 Tax=Streptomyces abikoensis TaxID=97398 RepID=UPI00371921D5
MGLSRRFGASADTTGTDGDDVIVCGGLDAGATVDARGGADTITLTGDVSGTVLGGDGADVILADGAVTIRGLVEGVGENDFIDINGTVAPRAGCTATTGTTSCTSTSTRARWTGATARPCVRSTAETSP